MQVEFLIPESLGIGRLRSQLQEHVRLRAEPPKVLHRTRFDSFDWRLHEQGIALEEEYDGRERRLVWRTPDGDGPTDHIVVDRTPRFARDLPPGRFRARLEPVLEMRELIPLVRTRSRIHALHVLDKRDKTVLRLSIEENSIPPGQGNKAGKLDNRLIVTPVRGYRKHAQHVTRLLEDLGLVPAGDDVMHKALTGSTHKPGDYSSKLNLHLDPGMRADAATKQILHRLLDIMLVNEPGTRIGEDTEYLHDFRVSIRRTRSALTQIKGVFPARVVERFKTQFAWLGQITTPTRDLDVYLLNFDEYRDSLPAAVQEDLTPLLEFLQRHRQIEHAKMLRMLDSARYARLVRDWRAFLEAPVPARSTLPNATRPVSEVAGERIWRVYRRVLKEGNAIAPETHAEALHELRKTCKKLRYLMEFFQSLYPADEIKALIRLLKRLQDNLGNFQDLEVQADTLRRFSIQMTAEGDVPPGTLMAMGMLVDNLQRRQHQVREEFADRFGKFSLTKNRKHFHRLFAPQPPATGEPRP